MTNRIYLIDAARIGLNGHSEFPGMKLRNNAELQYFDRGDRFCRQLFEYLL